MKLKICILLVVVLSISFCSKSNMSSEELENYFQKRGTISVSNNIVIVDISDQSFEELGYWPFSMKYYEKLIENLNYANAKLIVFDIELDEIAMKKFLDNTNYDNLVFNGYFDIGNEPSGKDTSGMVCFYPILLNEKNIEEFTLGINVLRKLQLLDNNNDVQINNDKGFLEISNIKIPKYFANQILVNYYGPANTFPYYHIDTVLDDRTFQLRSEKDFGLVFNTFENYLTTGTFKDKIVLVGTSAEELHDLFLTPFFNPENGQWLTPGVEILANFLEMVLNNNYINIKKLKTNNDTSQMTRVDKDDEEENKEMINLKARLIEQGKNLLEKGKRIR